MVNVEFIKLLNDPAVRFTIVLGSGFHQNAIGANSVLSSWDLLLNNLSSGEKLTGQYHLDFERLIQRNKRENEDSAETEKRLIKEVQNLFDEEQRSVLSNHVNCYPMDIFNPTKISDVISLNFDEIPEQILIRKHGVKASKFMNESNFQNKAKDSYAYLSTRFKSFHFLDGSKIRFWHPHGIVRNNKSIVLGLHRYSHMLETVLRIRNSHMQSKRENSANMTWYSRLSENPVLILGAGMSSNEWDMWCALTSRQRANGKRPAMFQMRDCECKSDVQHGWFEPLFTGLSYNEQWLQLAKFLAKEHSKNK